MLSKCCADAHLSYGKTKLHERPWVVLGAWEIRTLTQNMAGSAAITGPN